MSETRPIVRGIRACVTSTHYLATEAGFQILAEGGNAIDAAVASGFALHVVEPHMNGIGGECPIIVHSGKECRTFADLRTGDGSKKRNIRVLSRSWNPPDTR